MLKTRALNAYDTMTADGNGAFTLPGFETHYAPSLALEPKHLELHLAVDLDKRGAVGQLIWIIEARRSGETAMQLNAVAVDIESVSDLDGHQLDWRHDGQTLFVHWTHPSVKGQTRRLEIEWTVSAPKSGMFFGCPPDGSSEQISWMLTDHETERARFWLPCIDLPNVRTSLDIFLRAKSSYTRLAAGRLVSETEHDDGTTTSHWSLEQRCPSYLLCLAVGDFSVADGGEWNGVPIRFFAPKPYTVEQLQRSFGPTADMMKWMTARLGVAFPYPKYYQVAAPGVGGAMENISLTTWDDVFVTDETLHAEWGWLVDLINLHEMAHSYFGDAVVCRDYAHAWLKEGWATYMESVWLGDTRGIDALHGQMYEESIQYRREADGQYVRPIMTRHFNSSFQIYDGHLYPGSAWRIHMLRQIIGESDFWQAVTRYLEKYSGHVVETDDFRYELEAASGLSLARFFDQWIHSPGYPKLKCQQTYDAAHNCVQITIEQTQVGEAFGLHVGLFDVELDVAIQLDDGQWTTGTVKLDQAKHTLTIPAASAPVQVVIDPNMKVLHALDFKPGIDLCLTSITDAPTVYGRIQAVDALAQTPTAANLDAIGQAYKTEVNLTVKKAFLRALGQTETNYAMNTLIGLLEQESEVQLMSTLIDQLARYRDPRVEQALVTWLDLKSRPYIANGAALKALGGQRQARHIDRLKAAIDDPCWWGWVQRDARIGLGKTRESQAYESLLALLEDDDVRLQVRLGTVAGLAESVRWLGDSERRRVCETLIETTRDEGWRYGISVARALLTIGCADYAGAIESISSRMAPQWAPMFGHCAKKLRAKDGGMKTSDSEIQSLKKTVQDLSGRLQALEARLAQDHSDD